MITSFFLPTERMIKNKLSFKEIVLRTYMTAFDDFVAHATRSILNFLDLSH